MTIKILIVIGSIVVPILMIFLQRNWEKAHFLFSILALLSALSFGIISALAIQNILIDETVFMTNIHGIFLNPCFLITGAYLSVYLLYTISLQCLKEIANN